MRKVRIRFSKGGALRFIGHLDFLRVFNQAIRRAGLPAGYSHGFNPHMLLSFALPLPLGMESIHDYADLVLTDGGDLNEMAQRLQANAPEGLAILSITEFEGKGAASVIVAADYILGENSDEVQKRAADLLAAKEWIVPKKTKSGTKDTDIRADIFDIFQSGNNPLTLRLAASSGRFVNPLTVAKIITNRTVNPHELKRAEMYARAGEIFITL